jgi:hypothetical protein
MTFGLVFTFRPQTTQIAPYLLIFNKAERDLSLDLFEKLGDSGF